MKRGIWFFVPAIIILAGCIRTHRTEEVYAPVPPSVTMPSSGRTVERVYPSTPETPPPAPPAPESTAPPPPATDEASPTDVDIGNSVKQVLTGTTASANRVEAIVQNGVVTLRGTVPTVEDREDIVNRVSHVPGVIRVKDQMAVDLR